MILYWYRINWITEYIGKNKVVYFIICSHMSTTNNRIYLDSVKIVHYNLNIVKMKEVEEMENKPYHHGDLRNSLIEAGIELINTEGEKQFSLRKVSKLCGVSQAAPYSHFKDKEDLLKAMQEHVTNQFMEVLEESVNYYPNKNDKRAIFQMGKSYVMFFVANPQYFHFLFSQPCMEVNLSLDGDGTKNYPPFEILKKTVFRVYGESGMSKEKIENKIISLWAMVHGLSSIATMKNVHYNKDWETKIKDIIWKE